METKLDKFTEAYIACLLWAETDDNQEPLDSHYKVSDIATEALHTIIEDCVNFQVANKGLLRDLDESQCGHDFWLTRHGHGSGFWDRGLGEIGETLSQKAHEFGSCDPYIGDDGKLYLS